MGWSKLRNRSILAPHRHFFSHDLPKIVVRVSSLVGQTFLNLVHVAIVPRPACSDIHIVVYPPLVHGSSITSFTCPFGQLRDHQEVAWSSCGTVSWTDNPVEMLSPFTWNSQDFTPENRSSGESGGCSRAAVIRWRRIRGLQVFIRPSRAGLTIRTCWRQGSGARVQGQLRYYKRLQAVSLD